MAPTILTEVRRYWPDPEALRSLVAEVLRVDGHRIARRSRETTTHFKWLLASDGDTQQRLWLHEFKPSRERRPGFASSIHNHRYPFEVVALTGGYVNSLHRIRFEDASLVIEDDRLVEQSWFEVGATYAMAPHEFHRIDDIQEGTKSLILELPAVTRSSFSVDESGDRMIEHVPLEARISRLQSNRSLWAAPAQVRVTGVLP